MAGAAAAVCGHVVPSAGEGVSAVVLLAVLFFSGAAGGLRIRRVWATGRDGQQACVAAQGAATTMAVTFSMGVEAWEAAGAAAGGVCGRADACIHSSTCPGRDRNFGGAGSMAQPWARAACASCRAQARGTLAWYCSRVTGDGTGGARPAIRALALRLSVAAMRTPVSSHAGMCALTFSLSSWLWTRGAKVTPAQTPSRASGRDTWAGNTSTPATARWRRTSARRACAMGSFGWAHCGRASRR